MPTRDRRAKSALVATALMVIAFLVVLPGRAFASEIVQPSASPLVVAVAGTAQPAAITIVAGGFASGALVYVEQCDGVAPTAPLWTPTAQCDLGSSPAPAIADSHGTATFAATDHNLAFHPFVGESPQTMFNCLAPGQAAPKNGLTSYTNCSIRVSTNNAASTGDQSFRALAFTIGPVSSTSVAPTTTVAPAATTTSTTTTTGPAPGKVTPTTKPKAKATAKAKPRTKTKTGATPGVTTETTVPDVNATVLHGPPAPSVDLFSFSDPNVATGYVLLLGGFVLACLTISLRRRSADDALMRARRGDARADAG